MSRLLAALLLCTAATASLGPALAEDKPALPERIVATGTVRIAVNAAYPPMESRDPTTNEFIGFDIDLGNALAAELGLKAEWIDGQFSQTLPSLVSKRVDLIHSAMIDTKERQETVDFIDYLVSGQQVYAMIDGPIKAVEDMCGQKVAVSKGTTALKALTKWNEENCVGKGKPAVDMVIDSSFGQQIANMKQKRTVAGVQGLEGIGVIIEDSKGTMALVGKPITASNAGLAFLKEDTQLRDAYMWAMKRKFADGTYHKLLEKWNLKASAYPEPTFNNNAE
ncbi:ABC transporter substrate-binding protein [Shinella lacus]|nr:ABC transporter substrate-binding protein [Shinella lacus]